MISMMDIVLEAQAQEEREKAALLQSIAAVAGSNFIKVVRVYRGETKRDQNTTKYETYPELSNEVLLVNVNLYQTIAITCVSRNAYEIDDRRVCHNKGTYGNIQALHLNPFGKGESITCIPYSEVEKTQKAIDKLMKAKKLILNERKAA